MNRLIALRVLCCVVLSAGCKARDPEQRPGAPSSGAAQALPAIPAHAEVAAGPQAAATQGLHAPAAPPSPSLVFSERAGGVAQVVEKADRFQVVHNGRAGKWYEVIGEVALSPDGRRCAYGALADGKWRVVVDGKEGASFDAVKAPAFSPDGAHVAYQAMRGEQWYVVVDGTPNGGTKTRYLTHVFSGDSTRIAYVTDVDEKDRGALVVSDLAFRRPSVVLESGVSELVADPGRTWLAAVVSTAGKQRVVTVSLAKAAVAARGPEFDGVNSPAFSRDGTSIAYLAERGKAQLVVRDGQEAALVAGHPVGPPVIIPGGKGVGILLASMSGAVLLREYFLDPKPGEPSCDEAEGLVYAPDGRSRAYAARKGASWAIVLNGVPGPAFDRVVSPVFSPDGKVLAYRARKDGRRFAVVADVARGAVSVHAAYEQVFPVVFTPDGGSVAYGVKDGAELGWKVVAR